MSDRTCPECDEDRVCSAREAALVFDTSDWGVDLDRAKRVCSKCKAHLLDGEWRRPWGPRA